MFRTRGLSHLRLAVRDLDLVAAFYADVFGFEVVRRSERGVRLETPGEPGSLYLYEADEVSEVRLIEFGLRLQESSDLDGVLELAMNSGGSLISRTDHALGGASAVIADPSGHRISL